jgi:hypothetical protein
MRDTSKHAPPVIPLDDEQTRLFLHYVGEDLLLSNAARHIGITPGRLMRLMERGMTDIEEGEINSVFAQLYTSTTKKQAEKISNLLYKIELCQKNWQALAWKLEKCFKEEFSIDAPEFKQLLEKYLKLSEDYQRLKDKPSLQGAMTDGKRELDS